MRYLVASTLLVISLAGLILTGCSESDTKPSTPSTLSELFPIRAEDMWVYDAERYINDSLSYRAVDTVKVDTSRIIWGGAIWYRYLGEPTTYWRNGVDGVWRLLLDALHPDGFAEKYFGYPARAGQAWWVRSDDDSVSVVSTAESVTVPAGTFDNCYYYAAKRNDGSRRASVWVAPGVGIVMESSVAFAGDDTLRATRRLKGY